MPHTRHSDWAFTVPLGCLFVLKHERTCRSRSFHALCDKLKHRSLSLQVIAQVLKRAVACLRYRDYLTVETGSESFQAWVARNPTTERLTASNGLLLNALHDRALNCTWAGLHFFLSLLSAVVIDFQARVRLVFVDDAVIFDDQLTDERSPIR